MGSLAFALAGLQPPLGGRGAVQGHADGGLTHRDVGQEGETRGGVGGGGVGDSRVDSEVRDGGGKSAEL